jgi:integrase
MTSATTRRDSSFLQLQKRVPNDIVARARGRCYPVTLPAFGEIPEHIVEVTIRPMIKLSLRVRDPVAAKARTVSVLSQLEDIFESLRKGPIELTHKQAVALSGEVYRLVVERFEMHPGEPADWEVWKAFHWAAMEGRIPDPPSISWPEIMNERQAALGMFGVASGPMLLDVIESLPPGDDSRSLEVRFGLLTSWVLALHKREVTPRSRLLLLRQVAKAALDAGWAMKRAALGDYTPDPNANRFPSITDKVGTADLSMTSLFDRWRAEAKPAPSTLTTWRPVLASLRQHLKHEDVRRLTKNDIVTWKDRLVAQGHSASNINGSYLACVHALLAYGVRNGVLMQNVAAGIRVNQKRTAGTSKLPYEDKEVADLLAIAAKQQHAARRWIPLLAACSGARAGELAQLWAERVREIDGVFAMELRPAEDGGTFKNEGSERVVPLHPALIDAGFLEFVRNKRAGPLFYGRVTGRGERHASKGTVNHLAGWIRKQPSFDNPRKAPSHALRHWWKSTASRVGIPDSRADAIQGHKTQGEAARYRHFDLKMLAQDIAKIPIPSLRGISARRP